MKRELTNKEWVQIYIALQERERKLMEFGKDSPVLRVSLGVVRNLIAVMRDCTADLYIEDIVGGEQ